MPQRTRDIPASSRLFLVASSVPKIWVEVQARKTTQMRTIQGFLLGARLAHLPQIRHLLPHFDQK